MAKDEIGGLEPDPDRVAREWPHVGVIGAGMWVDNAKVEASRDNTVLDLEVEADPQIDRVILKVNGRTLADVYVDIGPFAP